MKLERPPAISAAASRALPTREAELSVLYCAFQAFPVVVSSLWTQLWPVVADTTRVGCLRAIPDKKAPIGVNTLLQVQATLWVLSRENISGAVAIN